MQEHSGCKVSYLCVVHAWLLTSMPIPAAEVALLPEVPVICCHCKHCLLHGLPRRLADNIASLCRDPQCQNGGILNAKNTSDTLHCATCSCPDGWRGADCSLCESVDVCPSRQGDKGALLGPDSTSGLTHPVQELSLRQQALTGACMGLFQTVRCQGLAPLMYVRQAGAGCNHNAHVTDRAASPREVASFRAMCCKGWPRLHAFQAGRPWPLRPV